MLYNYTMNKRLLILCELVLAAWLGLGYVLDCKIMCCKLCMVAWLGIALLAANQSLKVALDDYVSGDKCNLFLTLCSNLMLVAGLTSLLWLLMFKIL